MQPVNKDVLKQVPQNPGVYKYYDKDGKLIYVGKAKNLKNRVNSYFQKSASHSMKTTRMVKQICSLEYVIVDTEFDAFLLENALIKENQPKYNIMLRDDKTYPYIVVTNERFPKIFTTRKLDRTQGKYYGPYSNVRVIRTLLEFLHKNFQIRTCNLNLSEENVRSGKFNVCLEYHIGNCLGPCENKQSEADYNEKIGMAELILKGEINSVLTYFKHKMQEAAAQLEFEKAHDLKERLFRLENYQSKSVVSNPKLFELDVFALTHHEDKVFIHFMKVVKGTITATKNIELRKRLDETDEEVLAFCVLATRLEINSKAPEVLVNLQLDDDQLPDTHVVLPKIGDKRKLVDLAYKNALLYKKERVPATPKKPPYLRILEQLRDDLHLKSLPLHIECFDNSNIQGTNPVASMVCFKNAAPSKKDYRHYHVKTVEGPDDFASMREIVARRYKRLQEEALPLPDLLIVDGGKGQLSSAVTAMKEVGVFGKIPVIGIAKRLEEIYYPDDSVPLLINKKSESLKLIQQLRNEAHRFAITFHRKTRSKNFIQSELKDIPGVGPKSIAVLLKEHKSVSRIKSLPKEALVQTLGKDKGEKVWQHFHHE